MLTERYEILVTETGAPLFSDEYRIFDSHQHEFTTYDECLDWIKERYGSHKKRPVFCDTRDGKTEQVGWIYSFRNCDYSHSPLEKWNQRDWVEVNHITRVSIVK